MSLIFYLLIQVLAGSYSQLCIKGEFVRASKSLRRSQKFIHAGPTDIDVMAIETGVGSLVISWNHSCFKKAETTFVLIVENLNSSRTMPVEIVEIQNLYYRFEIPDNHSCDIYRLQIVAANGSTYGGNNGSITTSFPSLPDISPLTHSLKYSLTKNADEVILILSFNVRHLTAITI